MKLYAQVGSQEREIVVEPVDGQDGRWKIVIDGVERQVDARRVAGGSFALHDGDKVTLVDVDAVKEGELVVEIRGGNVVPVKLVDPRRHLLENVKVARPQATGPTAVNSPMPGKVVKLLVKPGDAVTAGQGLVVVEAMKMENELRAARAGTVQAVRVKEGQPVVGGETLLTLEERGYFFGGAGSGPSSAAPSAGGPVSCTAMPDARAAREPNSRCRHIDAHSSVKVRFATLSAPMVFAATMSMRFTTRSSEMSPGMGMNRM
jgi:biotin carboxyl carrier protein